MNMRWLTNPGSDHCPSCNAADGQVHDQQAWANSGIEPRAPALICSGNCHCRLEGTTDGESGSLMAIPVGHPDTPWGDRI